MFGLFVPSLLGIICKDFNNKGLFMYENMTDKDLVREAVKRIGVGSKNKAIIKYCFEVYGRRVSNSTVVKTIGAFKNRKFGIALEWRLVGRKLLDVCDYDIYLAKSVIDDIYYREYKNVSA